MECSSRRRRPLNSLWLIVVLLFDGGAAHAVDSYRQGLLIIPSITIGSATFTNTVVTIASIVSGPSGAAPIGSDDSYNPSTNHLTVPAVIVGATTYYNVVVTVGSVVSIGGLSGADGFVDGRLTIPRVLVGKLTDTDVVVTVSRILKVAGGMPALLEDSYDPTSGVLTIPAVLAGGRVYTNVMIGVGEIVSIGSSGSAPVVLQVSPNDLAVGSAGANLMVVGSGFTSTSVVQLNGNALPTSFLSVTQLAALVPAIDLVAPTTATITVSNSADGGPVSNGLQVRVDFAPVPVLLALSPDVINAGASALALTVAGSGFTPTTIVQWNGSARATTYVSPAIVAAQVTPSDLATPGNVSVTVIDASSGGTPSNSLVFAVLSPTAPILGRITPTSIAVGISDFTLTVVGTGFVQGSTIHLGNQALPTTLLTSKVLPSPATVLRAPVSASLVQSFGTLPINVVNPMGSSGSSNSLSLSVTAPSVDAVSYQINPGHSGVISFNTAMGCPRAQAWSANLGGPPSNALIVGGIVYVAASVAANSELFALNASNGATIWGPIAFSGTAAITYDAGKIFVSSGTYISKGSVSAVSAANGNPLWSATIPGQFYGGAGPVAAQGIVYYQEDAQVTAYDENSGAQLWSTYGFSGTSGSLAIGVDGVYTTGPCQTTDWEPATGDVIWGVNTGCEGGGGDTPVLAEGVLYSPINGAYGGIIYSPESGAVLGQFSGNGPPAVSATTSFIISSSTLQSIALANSQVNWSFAGDGALVTSPIVVNDFVFEGSSNGNLYTLNATTGALLGTVNLGAAIPAASTGYSVALTTGLSAGDGVLIVPAGNSIHAFVLSTNP